MIQTNSEVLGVSACTCYFLSLFLLFGTIYVLPLFCATMRFDPSLPNPRSSVFISIIVAGSVAVSYLATAVVKNMFEPLGVGGMYTATAFLFSIPLLMLSFSPVSLVWLSFLICVAFGFAIAFVRCASHHIISRCFKWDTPITLFLAGSGRFLGAAVMLVVMCEIAYDENSKIDDDLILDWRLACECMATLGCLIMICGVSLTVMAMPHSTDLDTDATTPVVHHRKFSLYGVQRKHIGCFLICLIPHCICAAIRYHVLPFSMHKIESWTLDDETLIKAGGIFPPILPSASRVACCFHMGSLCGYLFFAYIGPLVHQYVCDVLTASGFAVFLVCRHGCDLCSVVELQVLVFCAGWFATQWTMALYPALQVYFIATKRDSIMFHHMTLWSTVVGEFTGPVLVDVYVTHLGRYSLGGPYLLGTLNSYYAVSKAGSALSLAVVIFSLFLSIRSRIATCMNRKSTLRVPPSYPDAKIHPCLLAVDDVDDRSNLSHRDGMHHKRDRAE